MVIAPVLMAASGDDHTFWLMMKLMIADHSWEHARDSRPRTIVAERFRVVR
jgi:hypothetical protein